MHFRCLDILYLIRLCARIFRPMSISLEGSTPEGVLHICGATDTLHLQPRSLAWGSGSGSADAHMVLPTASFVSRAYWGAGQRSTRCYALAAVCNWQRGHPEPSTATCWPPGTCVMHVAVVVLARKYIGPHLVDRGNREKQAPSTDTRGSADQGLFKNICQCATREESLEFCVTICCWRDVRSCSDS